MIVSNSNCFSRQSDLSMGPLWSWIFQRPWQKDSSISYAHKFENARLFKKLALQNKII